MAKRQRVRLTQPRGANPAPPITRIPGGSLRDFAKAQPALWKGWLNRFVTDQHFQEVASHSLGWKVKVADLKEEAQHWTPYTQLKADPRSREWAVLDDVGTVVASTWGYGGVQ